MKKIILFLIFVLLVNSSLNSQFIQRVYFNGNNICNYIQNTGIFNQNTSVANSPGFYWPCLTQEAYCFTAGINAYCKINNRHAMFASSYRGELYPGYVLNNVGVMGVGFKIYKVKSTDNANSNPDYANWYLMVPYGAPYIDINNNCKYDNGIDKPGIKDASQTIFVCMTDAFPGFRKPGEGFLGGINDPLLFAEVRMTVWGYNYPDYLSDAQFIKYEIINKDSCVWDSTYFALYVDPDISSLSDYFGCDSTRNLGFGYSAGTDTMGAFGIRVLKGPVNKETGDSIFLSSFVGRIILDSCGFSDGFEIFKGFKRNHVPFYDPACSPLRKTKFVLSGDPETNSGWTPSKGFINNCSAFDTTDVQPVLPCDVKFCMSFGADNLKIYPGDTQIVYLTQFVAKGWSNTNSVKKLKMLSDMLNVTFWNSIVKDIENCNHGLLPDDFSLEQNYPNPFNLLTKISFNIPRIADIKIIVYDILGREINILANREFPPGYYVINFDAANYASGIYFLRLEAIDKTVNLQKKYSSIKKMAVIK